jgi:hypothetical protein
VWLVLLEARGRRRVVAIPGEGCRAVGLLPESKRLRRGNLDGGQETETCEKRVDLRPSPARLVSSLDGHVCYSFYLQITSTTSSTQEEGTGTTYG